jgi:hypothetical protein
MGRTSAYSSTNGLSREDWLGARTQKFNIIGADEMTQTATGRAQGIAPTMDEVR